MSEGQLPEGDAVDLEGAFDALVAEDAAAYSSQDEPEAPVRRPRRWKRRLAISLVAVVALGALGGGVAAAVDQHHKQVEKERVAAEKRAADAYVKAVRPLAIRVFDAVQPIQDSLDAFRDLRPGLWAASLDVATKSGAVAELTAVRKGLVAQKAPSTHRAAAVDLLAAVTDLRAAVQELGNAFRAAEKSDAECVTCPAEDHLGVAEIAWSGALVKLSAMPQMSAPAVNRGLDFGRSAPTRGGFIQASDLACATAQHDAALLPDVKQVEVVRRNLPKLAKILRTAVASLRKVTMPPSSATVHHRLDIELQSVTSLAETYEKLSAASLKRDLPAYERALSLLDEQLGALKRLSGTYRTLGVSMCALWFSVPEKKGSKQSLST